MEYDTSILPKGARVTGSIAAEFGEPSAKVHSYVRSLKIRLHYAAIPGKDSRGRKKLIMVSWMERMDAERLKDRIRRVQEKRARKPKLPAEKSSPGYDKRHFATLLERARAMHKAGKLEYFTTPCIRIRMQVTTNEAEALAAALQQ